MILVVLPLNSLRIQRIVHRFCLLVLFVLSSGLLVFWTCDFLANPSLLWFLVLDLVSCGEILLPLALISRLCDFDLFGVKPSSLSRSSGFVSL